MCTYRWFILKCSKTAIMNLLAVNLGKSGLLKIKQKKMGTFIKALAKYSFLINWKNISASVTTRRYLCSGESAEESLKSA